MLPAYLTNMEDNILSFGVSRF